MRRIEPNAAGLPVAVTDPTGAVTRFVRDVFGRVTTIIDPLGAITRFVWSVEGKPISRIKPDGSTDHWRYDAQGTQVEHRDPLGRVTRVETTHFDLASATIAPDGSRIEYAYDAQLRLVAVTNPQGLVWRYDHDALGRLLKETDFNGAVTRYAYDTAGQLVERTNGAGQRVRYVRDAMGRITERHTDAGVSTYQHDPAGRLRGAVSPAATLELEYDSLGRITAETVNGRTLRSEFDAAGRRIRRITPTGAVSTWDYDGNHRPAALRTGGRTLTFGFDAAGRELERILDTGLAITQAWDSVDQLMAQTVARQGVPVQQRGYRYLPSGYPSIIEGPGGARAFELDALDRITGVQGAGPAERYTYDAAGNITAAAWSAGDPDEQGARDYAGTLIQRAGNLTYQHDAYGRVVVRHKRRLTAQPQIWQYTWDADDRLTGVTTPDGTRWSYLYDPIGRRIAKVRLDGAERVDFVWDGTTLAEQIHSGGGATTWEYQPGNRRPLVQLERVRSAAQGWIDERFYSIVTDLVGAPSELIDPAGTLVWQARTTIWGASPVGGTPLRFPGQYHDAETGLHYNVFRYYDPVAGRYLSGDPLGLAPAPNPHAYVPNPTVWADPLGLAKYKCVQAGQTGAYSDLSPGTPGDALEAHHMPQKAMGFTSEADGGAIVLPRDEHVDTRTWGSRGAQTAVNEAGMSFRDVLARDMWDIRRIANDFHGSPGHYNQSLRELLEYYRTNFPGLINKP